jgi:hypothetical protein
MADATATPAASPPPFLEEKWHKATSSVAHCFKTPDDGAYETVELFDFVFLGVKFKQNEYFKKTGSPGAAGGEKILRAGVCAELMPILQKAQRTIYNSYAAQAARDGQTPSETGFVDFCNVKEVSGWQFRPGQHRVGSAIDIDAGDNPYTVTRTGTVVGGEAHEKLPAQKRTALRNAAVAGYENAWALVMGTAFPQDAIAGGKNETVAPGPAYDHFAEMNQVFRTYMTMAHVPVKPNNLPISGRGFPRSFDGDPASFTEMVRAHAPLLRGLNNFPDRRKLFEQIRQDYDVFQLVFAKGSMTEVKGGLAGLGLAPTDGFRDPCHGFLTIRKEIVEGIWNASKPMRWGGVNFGPPINGDMMHFDRMPTAFTKTGVDPNDGKFFFTKR